MIFEILRPVFLFALRQFFERMQIVGRPLEDGPLLVVANHPDLALDAMVVSSAYKRPLWYLAKAPLFKNPIKGAFLRAMHMTPLYRRSDDPSQVSQNEESFRVVVENFKHGRAVLIFPEGTSLGDRSLKPMKTGAARMLIQARAAGVPIKVQAVGLTYTDLTKFASSVSINVGEPFGLEDFSDASPASVHRLTDRIEAEIRAVTVDIQTQEHEWLVESIARVYRSKQGAADERERFDIIANHVKAEIPELKSRREEVEKNLRDYLSLCDIFGFDGDENFAPKASALYQLLAALLAGVGCFIFYLPYRAVGIVANRLSPEPIYLHSTKFLTGILIFSFWVMLLSLLSGYLSGSIAIGLGFFAGLIALGIITNRYFGPLRITLLKRFWPGKVSPVAHLERMRDELITELESLRSAHQIQGHRAR